MFQALGLFVGLPPLEPEDLDQEPLGEAMAADDRVRVALAGLGQMHFFTLVQRDQPVPLEAMDHLRDRGRREAEELGKTRRNDVSVLIAERVNRLEILLDGGRSGNC
jgi:hypothetical protein